MDILDSTISQITIKIFQIVKELQPRPLEEVYAVVFMDVWSGRTYCKKAVYVAPCGVHDILIACIKLSVKSILDAKKLFIFIYPLIRTLHPKITIANWDILAIFYATRQTSYYIN